MAIGKRRRLAMIGLGATLAFVTTGCLSSGDGGGDSGGDDQVEIMYGFANEQSDAFIKEVGDWADAEGIKVKFSPTPDFDKLVRSRVAGNNLPDIAIFPQPGITLDIARSGKLADLRDIMDMEALEESVVPGILDAATDDEGAIYAAPMSISVKSLVWYPKAPFEKAGYEIPKSHEELLKLTEKIKADGTTPWCIGIESGPATGWPATDWLEDYVLRVGGTEGYDKWVKHEIPFDDPMILEALGHIEDIWGGKGNVLGGRGAIASTAMATSGNPMFEKKPGCFLHRQASFLAVPGNFPDAVIADLDNVAGVFQLPPIEAGGDSAIMGGGDIAGLFSQDDEDSIKVLEFITGPDFAMGVDLGGFISPHTGFDVSQQPNETMKSISEIAYGATDFRFDGSDLMPGKIGAGAFWTGMVDFVGGKSAADVGASIQKAWDEIK